MRYYASMKSNPKHSPEYTRFSSERPHAEMIEGPEAFDRLRNAMRTILSVPKSALPPSPYKKSKPKRKRPAAHKG